MESTVSLPDYLEIEADGHTYLLSGEIDVEFNWVDFGIGAYEFWGAPGYDSRMGAEDVDIKALRVNDITDESGDEPEEYDTSSLMAALNKMLDLNPDFQDTIYEKVDASVAEDPYEGDWDYPENLY